MDCLETEACYMSMCHNPCEFTKACAKDTTCQAKMHRPMCTCKTGYEGNPATKCFKSPTSKVYSLYNESNFLLMCINY